MTSDYCVGSSRSQIEHSCTTITVMLTAVWDVHNVVGIVVKLLWFSIDQFGSPEGSLVVKHLVFSRSIHELFKDG